MSVPSATNGHRQLDEGGAFGNVSIRSRERRLVDRSEAGSVWRELNVGTVDRMRYTYHHTEILRACLR